MCTSAEKQEPSYNVLVTHIVEYKGDGAEKLINKVNLTSN